MLAKINSLALHGVQGYKVDIEIDINSGLPAYEVVGLPDTAVKESRERVRSAIKNSGYDYPIKRITINMAPADTRKEGVMYDLAIALGLIVASEQLINALAEYKDYIILGELSLDGSVREVSGILPTIIAGQELGYKKFIIPYNNRHEASFIKGIECYAVSNLRETVDLVMGVSRVIKVEYSDFEACAAINKYGLDFLDVKGQEIAKRALKIAVSGGHNTLMIGPPGAGKTMLAKCVPTIMPKMTFEEAIETTKIHSIAGVLDNCEGILRERPFRTPHHTATIPSLTGGGSNSKPGEISLAHNGVLFLDEMPEYSRKTLETLRQPLEDGSISISRAKQTLEYPAHFMLIASMNPCPCGNYGSNVQCKCSPMEIHKYISKLSGPLLDRIDIQIEVDSLSYSELRTDKLGESSQSIMADVDRVRKIQLNRFKGLSIFTNSQMSSSQVNKFCKLDDESEKLLELAFKKLSLSARGSARILKVARTIADIDSSENIQSKHIAEAIQYRSLDRKFK